MERDFLGLNWAEKSKIICKSTVEVCEVRKSLYPSKLVSSSPPQFMPVQLASMLPPAFPFAKMNEPKAASTMKQQSSSGGIESVLPKPFSVAPNNGYRNNVVKLVGTNAPLTIFYSGAVHVYHHISPQKAEAIMRMAGNGSSETKQIPKPAQNSSGTLRTGAIVMARKATLARFLEKRKSRYCLTLNDLLKFKFQSIRSAMTL
ncbi:hypothetical protein LguiA_005446 [Lonicera macranthoides]